MKSIHRLCVAVTVMLIAGPSWAGTRRHDVADSVHTDLANESQFDSVGTFLAGNSLCGATLITGDWAITAAHCGSVGSVADMTFEIDGILHEVGVSIVHPSWFPNKNSVEGNDLALLRIQESVTGITPAVLNAAATEQNDLATIVGFGRTGDGITGDTIGQGTKRAGNNIIDRFGGSGPFSNISNRVILMDFDRPGDPSESSFGSNSPDALEYMVANKDSGGGIFISDGGMKLAGVVSLRLPGPIPPVNGDGTTNSDYGDISGGTRISSHLNWINENITPGAANWAGGTGNWSSNGNWSPVGLPGPSDDVSIYQAGDVVTYSSGETFINSLSNNQSLIIIGGTLWVIDESLVTGTLDLRNGSKFGVSNTFTAAGSNLMDGATIKGIGGDDAAGGVFLNSGILTMTGNTLILQEVRMHNSGTINHNSGYLRLSDSSFENLASGIYEMQRSVRLTSGETHFKNDGLFRRSGSSSQLVMDIPFTNTGTLEVVNNTLNFTDDYTQSASGEMIISIGGNSTFGAVKVDGQTSLNGTLTVQLINGFQPLPGQTYQILNHDSLDGWFEKIQGLNPNSSMALVPTQSSTGLTLRATLPGDANFDDIVNYDDFAILSNHFGAIGMDWEDGDFNFDTIVNFVDFVSIANNFGVSASPLAQPNPEPSTLGMFTLWMLGLPARRISRR